jgi:CMP-N-acetylneuraminic acid synthetase
MTPKVTVYITCHNYARFVAQAIKSVYNQIYGDWELLIIDDGSTDDSVDIIQATIVGQPDKVRFYHNPESRGLPYCANLAIEEARGAYLIRLDADDYFDESALLTMACFLDKHPDVALVYPNYVLVAEDGSYLGIEHRKKVGIECRVLDLPAHGACTMVRRRVLKSVGGYSGEHMAQDGHEIWLKILNRYQVANVDTPLFFYRQHGLSLTADKSRLLNARRDIKRAIASRHEGGVKVRVGGVIPAKNIGTKIPNICLEPIAGKPLIDYAIKAALDSNALDYVVVTTDDVNVLKHCKKFPSVIANLRKIDLSEHNVKLIEVMRDAVTHLEEDHQIFLDAVVMLNVHTPLRNAGDIDEAVDSLLLYNVDSVVSVYEDQDLHFQHAKYGLEALNPGAMNQLTLEREALYVDNSAIRVLWRDLLSSGSLFGQTLGHIVMPIERSYKIDGYTSRFIVEKLIEFSLKNVF